MSITFTKLFSSITESTVWCESSNIRIVWITMLAMADRKGRVWASIPGLANRARVPLEDTEIALELFLSPDKYSRTPDYEGRRIEKIDGGWRLLNHEKYLAMRDDEMRREYQREWDRTHRKNPTNPTNPTKSDNDRPRPTHADADADIKDLPCSSGKTPSHTESVAVPKKPQPKKSPPDPNVKLLIDYYYCSYLARFNSPPPIAGGKCGAIAKRILAGRSLEDAKWLITAHLDRAPEMYERKNLYGLEHVLHAAPVLLARRAKEQGDYA